SPIINSYLLGVSVVLTTTGCKTPTSDIDATSSIMDSSSNSSSGCRGVGTMSSTRNKLRRLLSPDSTLVSVESQLSHDLRVRSSMGLGIAARDALCFVDSV